MIKLTTDKGDFDLFGDENIVQTFSIFNLENITGRSGEYSNVFNLPLTNNNIAIIGNAQLVYSTNSLAYNKVTCDIFIDGLFFKKGFISIESIQDTIKARFYSGNSLFYDLAKLKSLPDLDFSDYNHLWNYANAVASSANTAGYFYPVIDYGGQTLTGDIVDVRKILPSTYIKSIINKMINQLGYDYELNFDTTDYNMAVIPYSNKTPDVSTDFINLYSAFVGLINSYSPFLKPHFQQLYQSQSIYQANNSQIQPFENFGNFTDTILDFNKINTPFSANGYDFTKNYFEAEIEGTYTVTGKLVLNSYDFADFIFSENLQSITMQFSTYIKVFKFSNNPILTGNTRLDLTQPLEVFSIKIAEGSISQGYGATITSMPQTVITDTISFSTHLNVGEVLVMYISYDWNAQPITFGGNGTYTANATFNPVVFNTSTFKAELKPEVTFGTLIDYANLLPKIKCSDFLKDICIRFGLILNVNEDLKKVYFNKLDAIINNIPNAIDWSNKLDESNNPESTFKYDNYGQNNSIKHKEDLSIINLPTGTDYSFSISNANLELSKVIYESPFSASDEIIFDTTKTLQIALYDTFKSKFSKQVAYRIAFTEIVTGLFKFTDGTTTSSYIDTHRLWFIDQSNTNQAMGFGTNLIQKNSNFLISTLQNLRIVKADFNLNILDIINLDYFTPVYINQFQAYFFISSINQFNYTNPNLTEVELIKLNP